MTERRRPYGRWADDPRPTDVQSPPFYSATPAGSVRRAALYTGDVLLGHVWTDGLEAAGFLPSSQAGAAGVRAGAAVWRILSDAYTAGTPAAAVLDPALFRDFTLAPA